MLSIQFILSLFKNAKALQIIYFIMGTTVIQIADLFLTIYLTNMFGEYLIMALICCVSLAGLFFSFTRVKHITDAISDDCGNSIFPEGRFFELAGIFLAALLIYANRSWFNVMLIPVLMTIVILMIAAVASSREAMWFSLLVHLVVFVYFLVSYRSFVIRDREQKEKE